MSDKDAAPAEAPKKSKKMLMIIIIAVVVLGGGGAGAFFMLKGDSAEAKAPEPVKGAVAAMESAITINLADGHFLKMGFTLQLTADTAEEPDLAEAIDLSIDQYTGMQIGVLETEEGRETAKKELLEKIEKAYYDEENKVQVVMGLYFTQFVTQ